MTISGYSSAIVDTMLGWLKGFANWVLRLFNLAGSVRVSPLLWLSHNWLKLLIFFMIVGVAADILVWLVRWRPHWVWFRKERVIVNDEKFFVDEDIRDALDWDEDLEKNWDERDYVVASTVVKRAPGERQGAKRRGTRRPSTVVRRRDGSGERRERIQGERQDRQALSAAEEKARRILAERETDLFGLDGNQPDVTDFYEDEVFNVSNLPNAGDYPYESDGKR